MKGKSLAWAVLWVLLAVCAAVTMYAGASGWEPIITVGVVAALIVLIAMLVYSVRTAQNRKIRRQEGHLLSWEYTPEEAEEIIRAERLPLFLAARVRRSPCVTIVGRDHVLLANRYVGINDYPKLNLESAKVHKDGEGRQWLNLTYSFLAGRYRPSKVHKTVRALVPQGRESEAEEFVSGYVKTGRLG